MTEPYKFMSESTKKFLKTVGLIVLIVMALYGGLNFVLSGMDGISNNVSSGQSDRGSVGMLQSIAPSMKSGPSFSGEIARDSVVTMEENLSPSSVALPVDKKIIKTGNLDLKVEKAETAAEAITNIAKVNKGEVSNSNFYESGTGVKSGTITVRVPYQNFDSAFAAIKKVATLVVSESSNAQDITAEYIDLEARLKNTMAEEASFVAILSRSGKIEDVLAVTREIARVRGEIEQLQGQIRYLNSQTDMSTITVNVSEDVAIASVSKDWRPWEVVKLSVKQLLTAGQNFINRLIAFIIVVLPMLVIYALIIWVIYYIGRKIYGRFINK